MKIYIVRGNGEALDSWMTEADAKNSLGRHLDRRGTTFNGSRGHAGPTVRRRPGSNSGRRRPRAAKNLASCPSRGRCSYLRLAAIRTATRIARAGI